MTTYVALLRAINVAGHANVAMSDLRRAVEELGFTNVRTLMQTGNVVFTGQPQSSAKLEAALEQAAEQQLSLRTSIMVRTSRELADTLARNPFVAEAEKDPAHLVVLFLKDAARADAMKALQAAIAGRERVHPVGNSDNRNPILVTVKHFPGHGDTAQDSHLGLPRLDADRQRIETVELAPFRAAIAAGVDAVMTAHLAVPAFEPENEPATVSSKILTGLLREEMNFRGIVVTDAMDMQGLTSMFDTAEASVRVH